MGLKRHDYKQITEFSFLHLLSK